MRWDILNGGQLNSKIFLGHTTYKLEFATSEGLLSVLRLTSLSFAMPWIPVQTLPPWGTGGLSARRR